MEGSSVVSFVSVFRFNELQIIYTSHKTIRLSLLRPTKLTTWGHFVILNSWAACWATAPRMPQMPQLYKRKCRNLALNRATALRHV